jgi:hypothetical protein
MYKSEMKSLLVCAVLAACGGGSKPIETAPKPVADDASCPMIAPGTSVSEEDTANGGALVFVTSPASTGDVAKRAATLAQMHNQRSGPSDAMGMMIDTKSTAVLEDAPTGSRIVFTPTSPDDIAALQNELRMHASHLQPGSCRMAM